MRISSFYALFSYVSVQLVSFVVGWLFIKNTVSIVENSADVGNSVFFFAYIIFAAIMMLLVLKFYKGKRLFYFMELFLLFLASLMFFALFTEDATTPVLLAFAMVAIRIFYKDARNMLLLFVSAVIGGLLGASLDIIPAAVLALLLSLYDFAAVFLTKHMVKLAQELRARNAAFSVTFPFRAPEKKLVKKLGKTNRGKKKLEEIRRSFETIELGTGDLVIPGMLVVAALKISFWHGIAALIGGSAGIFLLFYAIDTKKGYWPALPPIVFFSLLATLIYSLVAPLLFK